MKEILKHKGYSGSVETSLDDDCLYGKLLHVRDLVTYEAETIQGLKTEFEAAVESYLQTCEKLGVEPKKPCSGTFNIRIGPELHIKALEASTRMATSLNDFIKEAVARAIEKTEEHKAVHHHYHQTFVVKQQVRETDTPGGTRQDETKTNSRLILSQGQATNH